MNEKCTEMMTNILPHLSCIPSFDGAMLFPEDIHEVLEFQIRCSLNNHGRLVFSVYEDDDEHCHQFRKLYLELHGNPIRNSEGHVPNTAHYPALGDDYLNDVAPATISHMMRKAAEQSEELETSIPVYIMRISKEAKRWEEQFENMIERLKLLQKGMEKIYEESFE